MSEAVSLTKERFYFFTCLLLLIVLLILVATSPSKLVYDEIFYIPVVDYIREADSMENLIRDWPVSAGPLHAFIHFLLEPLTHLEPPSVRFVNIGFLLATMYLIFIFSHPQLGSRQALLASMSVLGLPLTMVVSGLALTEIPAIFLFTAGQYFLILAIQAQSNHRKMLMVIVGGMCMGLSITGRQPYLAALLALPFLCRAHSQIKWELIIFLITAIIFPAPLFLVCKGFLPGSHAFIARDFFSIPHAVMSFGYAGILVLILAPKWFHFKWKYLYLLAPVALFIFLTKGIRQIPLHTLANHFLNDQAFQIYAILASLALIIFSLIFLLSLCCRALQKRGDDVHLYLSTCLMLVIGSAGFTTHQFSSRYTAMAIPLIVLVTGRFIDTGYFGSVRVALGGAIGLLSLLIYYYQTNFF